MTDAWQRKFIQKLNPSLLCIALCLAFKYFVFSDRRFVKPASLYIRDKFLPAFGDCPPRIRCGTTVSDFPVANEFLGSLPVLHLERFTYFLARQDTIYPDGALAMAMLSAFGPMLTALPMTAVDREQSTLLNAHRFRRETVVNSLQDRLRDTGR